jgi:hypothetical protein
LIACGVPLSRLDLLGIDQQARAFAVAHVQLELVVARAAALEEHAAARAALHVDHARRRGAVELVDARQQRRAAGDRIEHGARVVGLRAHPRLHLRIVDRLQPAIGVVNGDAEVGVRDRTRRCRGRRLDAQCVDRQHGNGAQRRRRLRGPASQPAHPLGALQSHQRGRHQAAAFFDWINSIL